MAPLALTREQVLGHRRRAGCLDERLPAGPDGLRRAAWAGLQDSMPRAALLSIHARVAATAPSAWEDDSLVQLWGPRYSVFVVAEADHAVFSLGRLPADARGRARAERLAAAAQRALGGGRDTLDAAAAALGLHPNSFRYAATTGTLRIRWDGARRPVVWTVPAPAVDPDDARRELARRYLHVYGPATPASFAGWAGVTARTARATFGALGTDLIAVSSPLGDGWALAGDEGSLRRGPEPAAPARLLPSGDAYFLLWGGDRELLVPDPGRRCDLWTPRVWPGAVVVDGEVAGTWRRAERTVALSPWGRLPPSRRAAVEAEAERLPIPDVDRIAVRWDG